MKHLFRFYGRSSNPADDGSHWIIDSEEELHHLRVLRLKQEDSVEVFDGLGKIILGNIKKLSKNVCEVSVKNTRITLRQSTSIVLALGFIKKADWQEALSGVVEAGVDEIALFHQSHTEKFKEDSSQQEKIKNILITACKQAKRAFVPTFKVYKNLQQFVEEVANGKSSVPSNDETSRLVLQPDSLAPLIAWNFSQSKPLKRVILLVGSEAGLSAEELHIAHARGFADVNLGGNILRAKTAASVAVSIVSQKLII